MEETPEVVAEVVEAVADAPVNPMIAIDSTVGTVITSLAFVYIFFILCFPNYRRAQIGICTGLAVANFLRIIPLALSGVNPWVCFFPIFLGCLWSFNALFSYWSMKRLEEMQARTAEIQAEIDRMQAEINRVENRTYTAEVWPPNPK